MKAFKFYRQHDAMDCGPTCLRIIGQHYGKKFDMQRLRSECNVGREGVSLYNISRAAEKLNFRTKSVRLSLDQVKQIELPCILHWDQNHFVVLYLIKRNKFYIADPAKDLMIYNSQEFAEHWLNGQQKNEWKGVVLMITPSVYFHVQDEDRDQDVLNLRHLLTYLFKYRKLVLQIVLGLCFSSLLQLILPFLSQAMVDVGINSKRLDFAIIMIVAQSVLITSRMIVDYIRSWILLHMSTRINLEILTDFLIKLMKLPIIYFESKMTGDIMQRMSDQGRLESFLTGTALNVSFSLFNLVVYSFVLAYYNLNLFFILVISSIVYSLWIYSFLKPRRNLDIKHFELSAKNQNLMVQLISGMQEIKMNNSEQLKRWEWEKLQARLFRFSIRSLSLGQREQAGAFFINEIKNLVLTFIVVRSVIDGDLTFGSMVAVQYIIGQLNSPIEQVIGLTQQFQEAKLSLERINEIQKMDDEEDPTKNFQNILPEDKSIYMNNLTFKYSGPDDKPVLSKINMRFEKGKTTAIVGMSGSGKTTILKLLMRFYEPLNGDIKIGLERLDSISIKKWRNECGAVMQDNFIFSDSIANNIAISDEYPDVEKLNNAVRIANIQDFIEELPNSLNTKIGAEGKGISQGQRQRIQIARAVYKEPSYIFFDEATNSLDSNNELTIMQNLKSFFQGRTVVIVAHRLSTIKDADYIYVLDKGEVVEEGNHQTLFQNKGKYYSLVINQVKN